MPPKVIKPKQPPRRRGAAAAAVADEAPSTDAPTAESSAPVAPIAPIAPVAPVNVVENAPPPPPAPEPVLPPAGRLDGLKKPVIAGPGARGRGTLKFQPKAVARKTKEERERLEKVLTTDPLAVAAESSEKKPSGRGRGSGFQRGEGRGRGRGRGGDRPPPRRDEPVTASGPFSLGSVITGKHKATIERRGDGEAGSGRSRQSFGRRVKREGVDQDELEDVGANGGYSSEDSEGPKIEVEFINLISDDEDEDTKDGQFPVRITRTEHVERQQVVNTEPTAGRKKIKSEVKVKPDPDAVFADVEILPDAPPPPPARPSRSPEQRRKSFSKRRGSSVASRGRSRFRTAEEKEEERYQSQERFNLLRDLGILEAEEEISVKYDDHGNADISDYIPQPPNLGSDLFYFQFPPHLPNLVPLMEAATLDDVDDIKEIKDEKGKEKEKKKKANEPQYTLTSPATVPDGQIGYLRIHKSGKMSVQWGTGPNAMVLDVARGMESRYPTEIVGMDVEAGEGEDERGNKVGSAWLLGNVRGRMVVSMGMDSLV